MTTRFVPRARGNFQRTRDHWWWRDGWGPGVRYLTWHLTFEHADELHRTAERTASALRDMPGVDVVPVPWLHLTMTGVGFAQNHDTSSRKRIADAGFDIASRIPAAPLVFDRIFTYEEGVCLSATSASLQELKSHLDALGTAAGGPAVDPNEQFHPHVSLAYFSQEISEPLLEDALDRSAIHSVTVAEPRLSLIELGRDEHVYTWDIFAQRSLQT